jgi:hypothetical protein
MLFATLFGLVATGQQAGSSIAQRPASITEVLLDLRISGSIELNGRCGPGVRIPDLPPLGQPQKPYGDNVVGTLQSLFSSEARLYVYQDHEGFYRVVEPGVTTDILGVRISRLRFDSIRFPQEALDLVLYAPEVQAFMHDHLIGQPYSTIYIGPPPYDMPRPTAAGRAFAGPRLTANAPSDAPSVSGYLENAAVSDALDHIASTLHGLWLYQNCKSPDGQRLVYFTLYPMPGRGWVWDGQTAVR